MTDKIMYFGTKERMTWIKAPAFNADSSKVGWGTSSQFLNGGASVRRSATAHKEYKWAWNLASAQDIAEITDYVDGLYGQDLIYFLDPFAVRTNLMPQYWAAPRLGAEDGPTLNGSDLRPTLVATETNTFSYPTKSAVYTFDATSNPAKVYIPIPAGYNLQFGAHGTATGTAAVTLTTDAQTTATTFRLNYVTNPSAEVNTTGWVAAGTGAVLSRQTSGGGAVGAGYFRLVAGTAATLMSGNGNTFTVTAGETFAFSARVRGTVGRTASLRATWTGATATSGSTAALASTTAWQTISHTGTVPAGATAVRVDVVLAATGGLVGDIYDFDSVMYERGTNTVNTYFDGSIASTAAGAVSRTNIWQGVAHASVSQQTVVTQSGTAMSLLSSATSQLTNYSVVGPTGVTISFWGTGTLTLSGMIAQVILNSDTPSSGDFISGQGHSGCRFAGYPSVQDYSAPQAMNLKSMSATLIETGAWE